MDIQMPEMDGNEVAHYIRNKMAMPTAQYHCDDGTLQQTKKKVFK
jgi:CheY-like chemotaxis protein